MASRKSSYKGLGGGMDGSRRKNRIFENNILTNRRQVLLLLENHYRWGEGGCGHNIRAGT